MGGRGWKEGLQYMSRGVTNELILHMNFPHPLLFRKVVRRRALFIKSAMAFAVLAVASAPPMRFHVERPVSFQALLCSSARADLIRRLEL